MTGESLGVHAQPTDDVADAAFDAWGDVQALPEAEHFVRWELAEDSLIGEPVCHGNSESSCHAYCPSGCELTPCPHMPVFGKSCGIVPWFEDSMQTYYSGPATTPRDAAIEAVWDGDCYLWRYTDGASS